MAAAALCLIEIAAHATPANLVWRTIETEHARINYHEGLDDLAQRLARMVDVVHGELLPLYEYESKFKVEILLVDHVDSPNGFVNVYPYNRIVLYVVPPDRDSVLNDYDDWLRVLISHEYTHVLQLDTKSGLPAAVNRIFGGLMHPNQYMPRWYTEGMAVYDESRFTAGGRERSSMFEMFLRMDVLEDRFWEIDQIPGPVSSWPRGHIPYLYGAKFMQYLADKYGRETFAALGYLYGQRIIPYSLNTILEKITDDNYIRLYEEWKQQLKARYGADFERLKALGLTELNYLTETGENHNSPIFFPTGDRLLYFHNDNIPGRQGWAVFDLETGKSEIVIQARANAGATIAPDGRRIVTSEINSRETQVSFHDLFLHDIERREARQITEGMRAREPAFAPDGKRVAFVQYTAGKAHLMVMNIDTNEFREPLPRDSFDQVFSPAWSPDGRRLTFIGWREGGFRDLYLYDFELDRLTPVTRDRALDMTPSWSFDGGRLYWSSDRTGIFNIYAYEVESQRTARLTNVAGGLFTPLAAPDGKRLFVSSYRSQGFDFAYIDLEEQGERPEPEVPEMRPKKVYNYPEVEFEERGYSPFPSLYPKIWHPTMGEDYAGSTLGVRTWGEDIISYHSWRAEFDMGIESGEPTFAASYSYKGWIPHVGLRASHVSYTLKNAGERNGETIDQDETRTSGSLSIAFPFRGRSLKGNDSWSYSHRIALGANFRHNRLLNRFEYEPLESEPVFAETGLLSGMSLSYSYENKESFPGYVGAASGRALSVSIRANSKVLGSDYNSATVGAGYSEAIANPWVDYHLLALKFSGGMGISDYKVRSLYYIGGPPERDIVDDLIRENRSYGSYVRGYEPMSQAGDKYFLTKSEYRFVIWTIDRGVYTLPLYFRRLHMAPFFDTAYAWNESFEPSDVRMGVGGEIRLGFTVGYFTPITLRLGYQCGIGENGVSSLFMALDNIF